MPVADRPIVIITGSSGLIGSAVAARFAEHYQILGFDRDPPKDTAIVDFFEVDITSDDEVRRAVQEARRRYGDKIASVIHLAAYYDFSGEPSPLYDEVTVRGTERLLQSLRSPELPGEPGEPGVQVEQFVFSSTMLVHAPCQPGQKINEDWPVDAKWDYPRSKLETEQLIAAERGPIPGVLLRIAGVYDDQCHSIPIAHQIQRINERRMTAKVFPGDTATGQAFIHMDDLVDLLLRVVDRRAELAATAPGVLTLLAGEPQTLSYDEVQRTLAWLIHGEAEWETTQVPKAVARAGAWVQGKASDFPGVEEPFIKPWMIEMADDHYELDITRAKQMVGWEPKRTLRETLPVIVEDLKRDPAGFYQRNNLEGPPPPPEVEAPESPEVVIRATQAHKSD